MNSQWQGLDYERVFSALTAAHCDPIVIGGQACNFYSAMYLGQCAPLGYFIPFTSHDLDVVVIDTASLGKIADLLDTELKLAPRDNPSPVTAAIFLKRADGKDQFVQFMRGAYGVRADDVIESALAFEVNGSRLRVMHPLYLLESKLNCLCRLPQADRQDEKHARMAVCFCACFVHNLMARAKSDQSQARPALVAFEHTYRMAMSEAGLHCWHHYSIAPELALPRESLETAEDPRLVAFRDKRFLQLSSGLAKARAAYASRSDSMNLARLPAVEPKIIR